MGVHVLGPVHIDDDVTLRPRDRQALGVLVVRRDHVVTPDELADALWHDEPPVTWQKQVHICIAHLRKVLAPGAIETVDGGYRLRSSTVLVDADTFERYVAHSRELVEAGEPHRAAATYSRALGLFEGSPFAGMDGWEPALAEAARLDELRRSAEEELVRARLASGEHREVLPLAEALVREEPLREERWVSLALAQIRCERQAEALGSLRRARRLLRDQLGIDPGRDLAALEERVLRQDPALLVVPSPRVASPECPYKGLARLEAGDLLFGRDDDVERCVDRVLVNRLLVLAGPSGSGKSSLVRAGVVPELERVGRHCRLVEPTPDGHVSVPVPESRDEPPVLVVDQLEELFTLGLSPATLHAQLGRLQSYAQSVAAVVIVVRADHLVDLALAPGLGALVRDALHLLGPLNGESLREAITGPAQQAGLRLENGLVELVMRDCEGEPGALPMMSHALAETWRRREGAVLTVAGYRDSGGIRGAVARSADALYEALGPQARLALRAVLLRLVASSPDGRPYRTSMPTRSLLGDPDREEVLARLVRARLVTVEDQVVEIAHESLVRAWPRLRAWLEEDGARQRVLRHLAWAAAEWESLGRPESELYRGARLHAAQEQRQSAPEQLTPNERAFLDASLRHAAEEGTRLLGDLRRHADQTRRLYALAFLVIAVSLFAAGASRTALQRQDDARTAGRVAQLESLVSRSLALRATDRDDAALLAVEAARRWPDDPRTTSALLSIFTGAPGYLGHRYVADADSVDGGLIRGTRDAVVALDGVRLAVIDAATGQVSRRFPSPRLGEVVGRSIRVSADGRRVVQLLSSGQPCAGAPDAGGDCGLLVVHQVATGARLGPPIAVPAGAGSLAIDADGSVLAVGTSRGAIRLYAPGGDPASRPVRALPVARDSRGSGPGARAGPVAFGRDGLLYAGSAAGPVRVIDRETGRVLRTFVAPPDHTDEALTVDRDGLLVATGRLGLVAFDTLSGRRIWRADVPDTDADPCPWLAVSSRIGRVYCGRHFGEIEERDARTGERTGVVLDTQLGRVGDLDVTADGTELVAFGDEQPVITRWRLDGSGPVTRVVAAGHVAADAVDDDDGTLLVSRRVPPDARESTEGYALWDVDADRPVRGLAAGTDASSGRPRYVDPYLRTEVPGPASGTACTRSWLSADGGFDYCGGDHGEVWTVDTASRRLVPPTIRLAGRITSVAATRGGARIVVTARTDAGSRAWLVDGRTHRILVGPRAGPDVAGLSLGGVVIGGTAAGRLTQYDPSTLKPIRDLPGARGAVTSVQFTDDGRRMLATSDDQTAALYDVRSGTRLADPIATDASTVRSAFLSHDGRSLAATVATGIALWDLDRGDLLAAACDVAGRNLTATEWATYLSDYGPYRSTCPGQPHVADDRGT